MIEVEDHVADSKYVALVKTNEECITDDGYRYNDCTLVTSDNLEGLRRFLGRYAYCWSKGYVWEGDINEDDPTYFIERECNEKTNQWINRVQFIPYSDVEKFEGHSWKDIDEFRDEIADIQSQGCLSETNLYYGDDEEAYYEWEEGAPEDVIDEYEEAVTEEYNDPELDPYLRTMEKRD